MSRKVNKILLIQPSFYHDKNVEPVNAPPPLGLAYLAAVLEKEYSVAILDAFALGYDKPIEVKGGRIRYGLSNKEIGDRIEDFRPDIIGVSCLFSTQYYSTFELSCFIKGICPKTPLVLGGTHVSYYSTKIISETGCDFIVIGEGEYTLKKLVEGINDGSDFSDIDGLVFKSGNGSTINPKTEYIKDLDSLPFPARHLLPMNVYFKLNKPHGSFAKFSPNTNIITSRGCPAKCTFCSIHTITGRRFRARSPQNVILELEELKKNYGIKEVQFEDDNLTLNNKRATQIFSLMIEKGINIAWSAPNGIALWALNEQLIDMMKKSGCYRVSVAIESGDQYVLDKIIKKPLQLERVVPLLENFKRNGISTDALFVIGFPDETMEQIKNTFNFARTLPVDNVNYFFATPYPGTDLYKQCMDRKLLKDDVDFSKMKVNESNIETPEFSSAELEKMAAREIMIFRIMLLFRNPKAFFNRVIRRVILDPKYFFGLTMRYVKAILR